jgi:hypothetical protein
MLLRLTQRGLGKYRLPKEFAKTNVSVCINNVRVVCSFMTRCGYYRNLKFLCLKQSELRLSEVLMACCLVGKWVDVGRGLECILFAFQSSKLL